MGFLVIGIIALAALIFAGSEYWAEMATITDTSEPTADIRLEIWKVGLRMWEANPVFGVGPGNFRVGARHVSVGRDSAPRSSGATSPEVSSLTRCMWSFLPKPALRGCS